MGRAALWEGLPVERHLRLIDGDLDEIEVDVTAAKADLRKEMREGFAKCQADSEALRKLLVGLLIAVVTTSITIVGTVLVMTGGGT